MKTILAIRYNESEASTPLEASNLNPNPDPDPEPEPEPNMAYVVGV